MHNDFGYFEEKPIGRPYDLKLLRRMTPFIRPYRAVLTGSIALVILTGVVILVSVVLAHFVHPYWYLLTAFVGLNLLQSAFTNWCPAMTIFRKAGLKDAWS